MFKSLSKTELEIMEYFWNINTEITASDLRNHFSSKSWSKQTTTTFLKRLTNLGYLKIRKESIIKYYYSALISKEEYELMPAKNVLENIYNGSYGDFMCALLPSDTDQDEIARLKQILADFERKK